MSHNLLTRNTKMSKMSGAYTVNFGIPAYKSVTGRITCPFAGECKKFCYAQKGAYTWGNVKPAFERRLEATQRDDFEARIVAELKRRKKIKRVRIHDSGDFYSSKYVNKWIGIAQHRWDIQFYFYTKSIKMLKWYQERRILPKNMTVIYSLGGKQDHLIDTEKDRHSRVFKTLEELQAAGYANATNDDSIALGENHKIGLVEH